MPFARNFSKAPISPQFLHLEEERRADQVATPFIFAIAVRIVSSGVVFQ